jgi:DNA-binding NtrC family response regulator
MSSVLIVDDEPGMREILRRWLAPDYAVREAPDADAAVEMLASAPSDVVVCDVRMPGHDGLWLVAQIRERLPQTAIILATGLDSVPPHVSLQAGVIEYLVKQFQREGVRMAVKRAVAWHDEAVARGAGGAGAEDPLDGWLNGRTAGKQPPVA